MTPTVSFRNVTKCFGRHVAVEGVSYDVPEGAVCGLLGQNGAGKTTTIRMMLDVLRPTGGTIELFGLDSAAASSEIRARVGYLPEEADYYPWMTVDQVVAFNRGFFPRWDAALGERLLLRLGLPRERKLRDLSRGMRAKVGLVMAIAQRPDLLLLDDPTSGLDPIVRREFLEAMIDNVQSEGGTVLFSTHLVQEMERVADHVVVMHEGRLLLAGDVEPLKARHRRLRAVFAGPMPEVRLPGLERIETIGHHAIFTTDAFDPALPAALRASGFGTLEVFDMDLEEIFIETVRRAGDAVGVNAAHRPVQTAA